MLMLIGAGLLGWLTSYISPLDTIEPRTDYGRNGMYEGQCATELEFNSTHILCVSEYNHNI